MNTIRDFGALRAPRNVRRPKTVAAPAIVSTVPAVSEVPATLGRMTLPLSIASWILAVFVFLFPVAYAPYANGLQEFVRQTLLLVAVGGALIAVLTHVVRYKMLPVPKARMVGFAALGMGVVWLIGAVSSTFRYEALYGYDGTEGYAAFTVCGLILCAALVAFVPHARSRIYTACIGGSALALFGSGVSLFGVRIFPGVFLIGWHPFGSSMTLALISALAIILSYGVVTEYRPIVFASRLRGLRFFWAQPYWSCSTSARGGLPLAPGRCSILLARLSGMKKSFRVPCLRHAWVFLWRLYIS